MKINIFYKRYLNIKGIKTIIITLRGNKYFMSLFPFLVLIPSFLINTREINFFIYNGCIIYLITGYWKPSDASLQLSIVRSITNIFFLIFIICFFVFVEYHHKLEITYIFKILPFILICIPAFFLSFCSGYFLRYKIKRSTLGRFIYLILLINLLMINSGAFGWAMQCSMGGLLFIYGGYKLATTRLKQNSLVLFSLSGPLFLIESIFMFKDGLYHLLPNILILLFGTGIGIGLKILFLNGRHNIFYVSLSLGLLFSLLCYFITLNWCEYVFTIKDDYRINNFELNFRTLDGHEMNNSSFMGKLTVLYLWTTSCRVCFKKMPEVEKLTNSFIKEKDIQIFSVVVPNNDYDSTCISTIFELSDKYAINYGISMDPVSIVNENLNFNSFPLVIVVNNTGNLIYKGRFNNNPLVLVNNISSIVKKEYTNSILIDE